MSENTQTPAPEAQPDEANAAADSAQAGELFEVHGKKFNLSTPEGKGELKGFLEAMSSELGRKNNEVGTLRKFASAVKPDKDESEIIAQAKTKAQEGEIDEALNSVFSYSKAKIREMEQRQAVEKENDETWDAYLASRPELLKLFDKRTIRKVSEADLGIYDSEDPFKMLDSFWLPKAKSLNVTPQKQDTPPAGLSGGSTPAPSKGTPAPSQTGEKVDLLDIFDSVSYSKRSFANKK